jgi:bacteriocin-like protein
MKTKKAPMETKKETGGKAKKAEVLSEKDLARVQGGWSWGETNDAFSASGTGNKTSPDQIRGDKK